MEYNGDNPIVLIYHDMIDKRIKQNKEILDKIPNHQCKRLEGADLVMMDSSILLHLMDLNDS